MDITDILYECGECTSHVFIKLLRKHIEIQSDSNIKIPLEERGKAISFYSLSQEDKRQLLAAALISDDFDSYELMMNLEDQKKIFTQLLFQFSIGNIDVESLYPSILDTIITEKSELFEEKFDEEWEYYFNKQLELNEINDYCYDDVCSQNDILSYEGVDYAV